MIDGPGPYKMEYLKLLHSISDTLLIDQCMKIIGRQKLGNDLFIPIKYLEDDVPSDIPNQGKNSDDFPALPERVLAAAKIWTVIHYFFAYQDLMENSWDDILIRYLPEFNNANTAEEYHLAVAAMYSNIGDGHGFVRSEIMYDFFGKASPPVRIRFIEGLPVIVDVLPEYETIDTILRLGVILKKIDGIPWSEKTKALSPYVNASNQVALLNYLSKRILTGPEGNTLHLEVLDQKGDIHSVNLLRSMYFTQSWITLRQGRNQIPVFYRIQPNIGYVNLDRLRGDQVDQMISELWDTKAINF